MVLVLVAVVAAWVEVPTDASCCSSQAATSGREDWSLGSFSVADSCLDLEACRKTSAAYLDLGKSSAMLRRHACEVAYLMRQLSPWQPQLR